MLHINSSLAALEKERATQDHQQAVAYAQRVAAVQAHPATEQHEAQQVSWASLRRHDPEYARQKRARLARMAVRREQRDRLTRSAAEHTARLAGVCVCGGGG